LLYAVKYRFTFKDPCTEYAESPLFGFKSREEGYSFLESSLILRAFALWAVDSEASSELELGSEERRAAVAWLMGCQGVQLGRGF
jgi:hypothetical protein